MGADLMETDLKRSQSIPTLRQSPCPTSEQHRAWERLRVTIASQCGVREIVMAFDNDAETNPMVASGLERDADVLKAEDVTIVHAS